MLVCLLFKDDNSSALILYCHMRMKKVFLPLAKSSSSFLFVEVEGSLATKAGLAFACSAALEKIDDHILKGE